MEYKPSDIDIKKQDLKQSRATVPTKVRKAELHQHIKKTHTTQHQFICDSADVPRKYIRENIEEQRVLLHCITKKDD